MVNATIRGFALFNIPRGPSIKLEKSGFVLTTNLTPAPGFSSLTLTRALVGCKAPDQKVITSFFSAHWSRPIWLMRIMTILNQCLRLFMEIEFRKKIVNIWMPMFETKYWRTQEYYAGKRSDGGRQTVMGGNLKLQTSNRNLFLSLPSQIFKPLGFFILWLKTKLLTK